MEGKVHLQDKTAPLLGQIVISVYVSCLANCSSASSNHSVSWLARFVSSTSFLDQRSPSGTQSFSREETARPATQADKLRYGDEISDVAISTRERCYLRPRGWLPWILAGDHKAEIPSVFADQRQQQEKGQSHPFDRQNTMHLFPSYCISFATWTLFSLPPFNAHMQNPPTIDYETARTLPPSPDWYSSHLLGE